VKFDSYAWRGGREAMLRMGREDWPTVLILPPLFEEANRTRATLVQAMRLLSRPDLDKGVASILPDFPGTGDSPLATHDVGFEDWVAAVEALAELLPRPRLTVAIRGGALLDRYVDADARWRLMPETGARLLRDMVRATALTSGRKAAEIEAEADAQPTRLAGNLIAPALFAALNKAAPDDGPDIRTVRTDDRPCDHAIAGDAVWRRAEPVTDSALHGVIGEDIFCWALACAAR